MTPPNETTDVAVTLGEALIAELGRRGMRGAYFDYRGYCELRRIDSVDPLQQFFNHRGFWRVSAGDDLEIIAMELDRVASRRGIRGLIPWLKIAMHLAPLFCG